MYAQHNDLTAIGVVFWSIVTTYTHFMHRSLLDQVYPGEILTNIGYIEHGIEMMTRPKSISKISKLL